MALQTRVNKTIQGMHSGLAHTGGVKRATYTLLALGNGVRSLMMMMYCCVKRTRCVHVAGFAAHDVVSANQINCMYVIYFLVNLDVTVWQHFNFIVVSEFIIISFSSL